MIKKWFYAKVIADSRQNFSVKNYPFDDQKLLFRFESSEYSVDDFVFKADLKGSNIDSNVYKQFDEWDIKFSNFSTTFSHYETNFGDKEIGRSVYPRFEIEIQISRKNSWLILFKLTIGIIVAFLISVCVFWIRPNHVDPRFGLSVGGLFAAIGNKYTVDSVVPISNSLSLIDKLHNLTFIYIFMIIVISVISLNLFDLRKSNPKFNYKKIDRISFYVLSISFATFFSIIILANF